MSKTGMGRVVDQPTSAERSAAGQWRRPLRKTLGDALPNRTELTRCAGRGRDQFTEQATLSSSPGPRNAGSTVAARPRRAHHSDRAASLRASRPESSRISRRAVAALPIANRDAHSFGALQRSTTAPQCRPATTPGQRGELLPAGQRTTAQRRPAAAELSSRVWSNAATATATNFWNVSTNLGGDLRTRAGRTSGARCGSPTGRWPSVRKFRRRSFESPDVVSRASWILQVCAVHRRLVGVALHLGQGHPRPLADIAVQVGGPMHVLVPAVAGTVFTAEQRP